MKENDDDFVLAVPPNNRDAVRKEALDLAVALIQNGWALEDARDFGEQLLEIRWLAEVEYEPLTRAAQRKLERANRRRWWQR